MGGALLMTSLAKARAAGIAEDRLIHVWGGASAEEPRDYLIRDQFFESHAAERRAQGGDGSRRRRRQGVRRDRALQLLSLRAEDGAADAGARRRRAADGDRRADVLRRAAQHLHDACGLRDGAQAARRRQARPALRPGRLRHQASRAGAVAAGAAARRWRRIPACRPKPTGNAARCPSSSPRPAARARSKVLR